MTKPDLKIFTDQIEPAAKESINTLLAQPAFADAKVRIMPDVHAGKGCVIGFTANLGSKVIPNVVGVDIGCGMLTVKLQAKTIDYDKLDYFLRSVIPSGMSVWAYPSNTFDKVEEMYCYDTVVAPNQYYIMRSIGTLGGGNHFIEIDRDSSGDFYLIIHTGSRNLGLKVCNYYQALASQNIANKCNDKDLIDKLEVLRTLKQYNKIQEVFNQYMAPYRSLPKELHYLEGEERRRYMTDMRICQEYAEFNRNKIAELILAHMGWQASESFHTVHNYISFEDNIIRKGAISAKWGERLLIPINMKDGCILGVGKGNADWNYSAPHGAGRLMSRSAAKRKLSLTDFRNEMKGVFTSCINGNTLDEAPMAYRRVNDILSRIGDTVEGHDILKSIYNFKAS